jgi:hypothetical protein
MLHLIQFNANAAFGLLASVAVFCLAGPGVSTAQDIKEIKSSANIFIAGKTVIDPPRQEPKNTHAYVTLTGPGALAIYRTMRVRESEDICRGDGWKYKAARNFVCAISRNGREAECDFSVNLTNGQMDSGRAC